MAEIIMAFSVFLLVAAVMLGIGISQYKSKTPVAFYSGEKPPKESELPVVFMIWYHGKLVKEYRKDGGFRS